MCSSTVQYTTVPPSACSLTTTPALSLVHLSFDSCSSSSNFASSSPPAFFPEQKGEKTEEEKEKEKRQNPPLQVLSLRAPLAALVPFQPLVLTSRHFNSNYFFFICFLLESHSHLDYLVFKHFLCPRICQAVPDFRQRNYQHLTKTFEKKFLGNQKSKIKKPKPSETHRRLPAHPSLGSFLRVLEQLWLDSQPPIVMVSLLIPWSKVMFCWYGVTILAIFLFFLRGG